VRAAIYAPARFRLEGAALQTFLQVLDKLDGMLGVVIGAGLTHGFSARSRKHQEDREDSTRWYAARFEAYSALIRAMFDGLLAAFQDEDSDDERKGASRALSSAVGQIRLVGSPKAVEAAEHVLSTTVAWAKDNSHDPEAKDMRAVLCVFEAAAREDLGQREIRVTDAMRAAMRHRSYRPGDEKPQVQTPTAST
jgi:hypothetical protein